MDGTPWDASRTGRLTRPITPPSILRPRSSSHLQGTLLVLLPAYKPQMEDPSPVVVTAADDDVTQDDEEDPEDEVRARWLPMY